MIKLINLLELGINSYISIENVDNYYDDNIQNNTKEFSTYSLGMDEIRSILYDYGYDDYEMVDDSWGNFLIDLQQTNKLNQFYRDLRNCVKKYVGKEILNELEINRPKITFIPANQIYTWTYKGGSKECDEYCRVDEKIIGVYIFNKYLFLLSPKNEINNLYFCFNIRYFEKNELDTWFNQDIDLKDDPITLQNLKIIG